MKKLLLGLAVLIGLNGQVFGYATLGNHYYQDGQDIITFSTNVSDVRVLKDGEPVGVADTQFDYNLIRTGQPVTFTFEKEGYKTETVTITPELNTEFWMNALSLYNGVVSSSTDSWFTKNAYEYSPNQFYVELKK